jgi:GNAT superfamily N-acetyltransferase
MVNVRNERCFTDATDSGDVRLPINPCLMTFASLAAGPLSPREHSMPSASQDDLSKYGLLLEADLPLDIGGADPLDFVVPLYGHVRLGKEVVGKFALQHVRVDWARRARLPASDLFACDPTLKALYPLLFRNDDTLRFPVTVPEVGANVLFVDALSIVPAHRGKGLGARVLERLALDYGRVWAVMALRAAPDVVDFDQLSAWTEQVYAAPFQATGEAAKSRLRAYWSRYGYKRLGDLNDYMARDVSSLDAVRADHGAT